MRFRGSVAIDLGTVNTLVWVAGRGIVLEEPTAIAIDTGVGKVAAVGEAADALADKEPQDIEVIHPLRDGVIADLDATAAMLHAFLRRTRRFSLVRRDALVCVPSGATPVERRSIIAALSVRRPRYNVRLIDEPVAAAAGAGFDLTGGAGGFVVDIGGGTTEVAAVAGWRVVRSQSLRKAGNAMDEAIVQAMRSELGLIISQRAARHLKTTLGVTGGAEGFAEAVGLDIAHRAPRTCPASWWPTRSSRSSRPSRARCTRCSLRSRPGWPRTWSAARSGWPAAARCCPAWPAGSRPRPASARSWSMTRCGA
jgi:rod shape-determining protein MreB